MTDRFPISSKLGAVHFARALTPRSLRGRLLLVLGVGLIIAHGALAIGIAGDALRASTISFERGPAPTATEVAVLDEEDRGGIGARPASGQAAFAATAKAGDDYSDLRQPIAFAYPRGDVPAAMGGVEAMWAAICGHVVLLLVLGSLGWIAIKQVVQPLAKFTAAANALQPEQLGPQLSETGPSEVVAAAKAFNEMRARITHHIEERIHLLSAFSHDMQTPITRMRLRAELAADFPEREKLLQDLAETERLVQEGIAYAKNAHVKAEDFRTVDLTSLIESIAADYQDTGRQVSVVAHPKGSIVTKPRALRRILSNFIDNSLKYAGAAEIAASRGSSGETVIAIADRGPGIAEDLLDAVKKPFVRIEHMNCEGIAGAGLGLAIAQQLATEIQGSINLRNRPAGGLIAEITLF
ncbi:HAMP domain-containing protein [Rhizobium lusitanum]|uniref:histidine kinase n=1 Tax=Rhizobium lusitanum TaxID=293958 RepID=A0A6L9UDR2_9HYPH|nr:ATP-binding protein [Rhizobium lusitanum]NEI74113.1 HAMP domain-containing protein [Rhizobium lusitanum]